MSETPLEQAIAFIESLTADPLLMGVDDIEMTLEDVQDHAHIELESIRRKIGATPAPQHNVMGIKPLEWYPDPGAFPYKTWGAQSPFGRFLIEEVSAGDSPAYEVRYTPHHLVTIKDGLPEAREAAQADFERRVRDALSTAITGGK